MPDGRTLTRIIASLVGALGAAALSLDRYDLVKLSRRSVVAAIAAVALGTAGAAIAEVFLDRSGVRRLKFERDVRQQLRSAIASTATPRVAMTVAGRIAPGGSP